HLAWCSSGRDPAANEWSGRSATRPGPSGKLPCFRFSVRSRVCDRELLATLGTRGSKRFHSPVHSRPLNSPECKDQRTHRRLTLSLARGWTPPEALICGAASPEKTQPHAILSGDASLARCDHPVLCTAVCRTRAVSTESQR